MLLGFERTLLKNSDSCKIKLIKIDVKIELFI
jgi:hypothetical protein